MKKTILIGVTSSIAAYKSVQLVSDLIKKGYDVEVIMSKNATQFIQPLTFSTLTKHKTYVDTFEREVDYQVEHISLAKKADVFLIAPASANVIAKVAHGIGDDMLTTTFLAANCPKLIAPAMNTQMYNNPITQDNMAICKRYGMKIIAPECGRLACDEIGSGKLASIDTLIDALEQVCESEQCLAGKKVMITAGPTIEKIDPVRYITNHSSGKMGYALAKVARNMGADVTLISGPVALSPLNHVKMEYIETTKQLKTVVENIYENQDYIICAAAPADYGVEKMSPHKIKKSEDILTLDLKKQEDVLKFIGEHKTKQKICGFAAESENAIANAKEKLIKKNCDMIVVNNILNENAGFKSDTNVVSILNHQEVIHYDMMSKEELAKIILKKLIEV
ncbi:MAG: bifunctional phosphopantothenoylcysteine decarboxylase/phosphopantothenate--cysteine ligase CoaBC [Erysipelotrichia bacterium]|nr:bifunctional phosphopantothenoylcysteine decarboxylase/phosphopantothenate--cysteine ligase CoaBC [Erysipelotrichia bacterium]NCC54975.1 bifunctional phosphopantothenoylcysteine decarboxylase/phosphopantothenate--cysteine ligase CoaBC [Erysipelotrichia bacterium]